MYRAFQAERRSKCDEFLRKNSMVLKKNYMSHGVRGVKVVGNFTTGVIKFCSLFSLALL